MPDKDLDQEYEGQLALDVFQTEREIVVKAPIAGVKLKDISITVTNETLTIKGNRMVDEDIDDEDYFTQECYWGPFSRSIILPSNVETDKIMANFKDGILRVVIPKTKKYQPQVVQIKPD